jgi:hypothetical protein
MEYEQSGVSGHQSQGLFDIPRPWKGAIIEPHRVRRQRHQGDFGPGAHCPIADLHGYSCGVRARWIYALSQVTLAGLFGLPLLVGYECFRLVPERCFGAH